MASSSVQWHHHHCNGIIITTKEGDDECEDVFYNSKQESYVIVNGDLRKLYVLRPVAVEGMLFAFFATRYYKLQSGQRATVNPESNVGEDSDETIVGEETMAPLSMNLANNQIMK